MNSSTSIASSLDCDKTIISCHFVNHSCFIRQMFEIALFKYRDYYFIVVHLHDPQVLRCSQAGVAISLTSHTVNFVISGRNHSLFYQSDRFLFIQSIEDWTIDSQAKFKVDGNLVENDVNSIFHVREWLKFRIYCPYRPIRPTRSHSKVWSYCL